MAHQTWEVEIQKILDNKLPISATCKQIKNVCFLHGKASMQTLDVDEILPHPANRGGRLLVAADAHSKGLTMVTVGADVDLVKGSVGWEMPSEPAKAITLKKIENLVQNSDGLLAPINGKERVLSTDASHTVAFIKASKHGCRTHIKELQDQSGNLRAPASFKGDFQAMAYDGWEWCVISRDVQAAFPQLPELFQRGLNAKHAAVSRASEIEVAKSLHDLSKTMSLSEATHEVHMSQPLCASYISKVALYVENFSGAGELIDYLDEFTKAMGCSSLSLGKDFMTALADLQIKSTQTTIPFCRLAIWLAQVTNTKVVDGIAKHLQPSHIQQLRKDASLADVEALELLLKQGWEMGPASSKDVATGSFTGAPILAFGKFAVRCILHHFRAEKDSREPKGFKSILEINDLYIKEISGAAQSAKPLAKQPEVIATLASTSDPRQVIIKQHRFLADHTLFVCKDFGTTIFKLKEITHNSVQFLHKPLFDATEHVEVPFSKLKDWRGVKTGNMPVVLNEAFWSPCLPQNNESVKKDALKAAARAAMHAAYDAHSATEGYGLGMHPTCVFIKTDFKYNKGEFKIVIFGQLKELDVTKIKKGEIVDELMLVSQQETKYQVQGMKKLPETADEKLLVSPFFLVETTNEPSESNMELCRVKSDGWSVPALVNTRQVKSNEVLRMFVKDQGDRKQLSGASKRAKKASTQAG